MLCASTLLAKTAETHYFRARLSPANEVPAVDYAGSGACTAVVHIVRGDNGQIESGSVDFHMNLRAPEAVNYTGAHIHEGAAGTNGPVVINAAHTTTATPAGLTHFVRPAYVAADNQVAVTTLTGLLLNPAGYYFNVHTSVFPGGAVRGQMERAEVRTFGTIMSPLNEVPALPADSGRGTALTTLIFTRNEAGQVNGATVQLTSTVTFPEPLTITGFHIHDGAAGINGPVTINSSLPVAGSPITSANPTIVSVGADGFFDVDLSVASAASTVRGLLVNPAGYYMNVHTTTAPGGLVRGQLRTMDRLVYQVEPSPANEVPPITGLNASGTGLVIVSTLRNENGSVLAAMTTFDMNYRFPTDIVLTGMHLHTGRAGENGPVTVNSGLVRREVPGGQGNITLNSTFAAEGAALEAQDLLVRSPDALYFNLHTSDNPGGAIRAQVAGAIGTPVITSVVSANLVPTSTTLAPGGAFTIFGRNLSRVTGTLEGWQGVSVPDTLNGVAIGLGAGRARLLFVSPTQVNGLAPFDVVAGMNAVAIFNGASFSAPATVRVAAAAPAIFAGFVLDADTQLPYTDARPAAAGNTIAVFSTGLGATLPGFPSGNVTPNGIFLAAPATATIGGVAAEVVGSAAVPGSFGLYATAIRVPAGAGTGPRPLQLRMGDALSNMVMVPLR
ncbi:MAG: CHRD domain-containing protein [Bryobacteraceae bacterium]|nr:CHRD domain-containing protein [Bryobacteraceae bacterium]